MRKDDLQEGGVGAGPHHQAVFNGQDDFVADGKVGLVNQEVEGVDYRTLDAVFDRHYPGVDGAVGYGLADGGDGGEGYQFGLGVIEMGGLLGVGAGRAEIRQSLRHGVTPVNSR